MQRRRAILEDANASLDGAKNLFPETFEAIAAIRALGDDHKIGEVSATALADQYTGFVRNGIRDGWLLFLKHYAQWYSKECLLFYLHDPEFRMVAAQLLCRAMDYPYQVPLDPPPNADYWHNHVEIDLEELRSFLEDMQLSKWDGMKEEWQSLASASSDAGTLHAGGYFVTVEFMHAMQDCCPVVNLPVELFFSWVKQVYKKNEKDEVTNAKMWQLWHDMLPNRTKCRQMGKADGQKKQRAGNTLPKIVETVSSGMEIAVKFDDPLQFEGVPLVGLFWGKVLRLLFLVFTYLHSPIHTSPHMSPPSRTKVVTFGDRRRTTI